MICELPDSSWPVLRTPRIWEGWPDDLPGIMREAAKRLEQMPWIKPVEALRLWADALDSHRQIEEADRFCNTHQSWLCANGQGECQDAARTYAHPRLNELARLGPDWDSYGAPPPTEAALAAADRLMFVPTGEGGMQIELHKGGIDIDVTVSDVGKINYVYISGEVEVDHDL